ncbi:MAG: hypothetical protein ABSB95_03570 [Dissulfurispiraceae bacterium]|jgi:hypothetical protein
MGECGTRCYANITKKKVDAIISELQNSGAVVSGTNPWVVGTNQSGVKLSVVWTESNLTLAATVMDAAWYVPRAIVWDKIDELMHHIQCIPDTDVPA